MYLQLSGADAGNSRSWLNRQRWHNSSIHPAAAGWREVVVVSMTETRSRLWQLDEHSGRILDRRLCDQRTQMVCRFARRWGRFCDDHALSTGASSAAKPARSSLPVDMTWIIVEKHLRWVNADMAGASHYEITTITAVLPDRICGSEHRLSHCPAGWVAVFILPCTADRRCERAFDLMCRYAVLREVAGLPFRQPTD